jgi:glycine cleavage system pyridoxal-binding protein P
MDKNEYARNEIPQLIRRARATTETVKDQSFNTALSDAEKAVEENDIPRAVGYLDRLNKTPPTTYSPKLMQAMCAISDFITKYDNYEQVVDAGTLARIESKIDDLVVSMGRLEKANDAQPNVNVTCTNQQNQSAT